MAKRLFIFEQSDGQWDIVTWTPWRAKHKRAPKIVEPGIFEYNKTMYTIDPSKFRNIPVKPWFKARLVTDFTPVQIWKVNDPEPLPLISKLKEKDSDISGDILSKWARSRRVQNYLHPEGNVLALIAMLSLLVNIVLVLAFVFRK